MSPLNPDQAKWKSFFDSYWKLIYDTARKAGLTDAEAQEVVQDVVVAVAQKTPNLGDDAAKASFKGWVIHVTRCRISDKLSKRRDKTA
jgi:RNA polymerase sigma-70 factor (ECF subfamily)